MVISRDEALTIQRRAMRDWVRLLGAGAPDSRVIDGDAVTAAIVPSCPQRSIVNSVAFSDPAALLTTLDDLAAAYERAGIAAWTVWVPDFDHETTTALESAGHQFDGQPMAMVLELENWEPPELGDLDWDADADPGLLGPLNDLAYGLDPESGMGRALAFQPSELVRLYQARVDGEPGCVLATMDHGGEDLGFYFVATAPERRGRGLATRLMHAALADAKQRGLRTSSLQASAMGEPVYTRMGFVPHFRLHMYERRTPATSP